MPRKPKPKLLTDSPETLLKELYNDSFMVKLTSIDIMRNIAKVVDYHNPDQIDRLIPMIQKQMDIINKTQDTMLEIQTKIDNARLSLIS